MFLYDVDDQPYDGPKETYRVQCINLVLDQVDLNNLKIMQNYFDL